MTKANGTPEIFPYLRLIRSDGVGPVLFHRLIAEFDTVEQALAAMPTLRQKGKPLLPAGEKAVREEMAALNKCGGAWLHFKDDLYPQQLAAIDDAPPVLSALGDTQLLTWPMIGIVGARNASANGRKLAATIARDLGRAGYVIVSGLARGIDAAVHEAALETGTIAVVANGVDIVYPPENKKLHDAITQQGLILSENAVGAQPVAALFPRRNRIISGLSQAVIIIEAAAKSGSLITARFALDQGRDVFAVPGHPADPRATGPNGLIKTGQAQLIESAQDILNVIDTLNLIPQERKLQSPQFYVALNAVEQKPVEPIKVTTDQAKQSVLTCLGFTPCTIDQITDHTQLPVPQLLTILLEFELSGTIQRLPGDRVALL